MIKIGTVHKGYPEVRNIINLPYHNIQVVKVVDIFKIYTHIIYKLFYKSHQLSGNLFFDAGINKVDVNHFFNGISLSSTPWITTFETSLPRLGNAFNFWYKLGVKRLTHKSCKKIIALSQCTYDIQKRYLEENYPQYLQTIMEKMIVLHPQQKVLIENYEEKNLDNKKVSFLLIGNQIFSKGGREAVNVISRLYEEGYNVELSIISVLETDSYATKTSKEDVKKLLNKIQKHENCINLLGKMPNKQVLEKLKETHVVLLPTYADTYGYALLEAQAAGCPIISTDIRALPEINNDECGWLIKVPKDKNENGILKTEEDRKKFSDLIEKQLYDIIKDDILINAKILRIKGELSLQRIKKEHDPVTIALQLESIYKEALK